MHVKPTSSNTVWETTFPLPLVNRGKVRDIYAVGDDKLLVVTTDRLSAFDVVLPTPVPDKGKVLNQTSIFWFRRFAKTVPNHFLTADVRRMGFSRGFLSEYGNALQGRSMLVDRAAPLSVECVVRGYLAGSGWKDYQRTGAVCGHPLPPGLLQCGKLPKPLFTPATKESTGHDININFEETARRIGKPLALRVRDLSIRIYLAAAAYARSHGILVADTKFEFGLLGKKLILIDEVLTPDSSRFWPAQKYAPGHDQPSFDKQIVRNYLLEIGWDQKAPGPALPEDVTRKTALAYRDVYRRLTGKALR